MSSALHLLHRAGQCADEMFAVSVGEVGLTPRQFAVMAAIANSEEPSQTTLVERTGIDRWLKKGAVAAAGAGRVIAKRQWLNMYGRMNNSQDWRSY